MEISIIIPTCQRPHLLHKALEGIAQQTIDQRRFEVLVVDNSREEESRNLEINLRDQIRNIRFFTEKKPGLHAARHLGIKEARTDILVFADDDVIPFPTWIESIHKAFSANAEIVLMGGKSLPIYEIMPYEWIHDLWDLTEYGKINGWYSLIDLGDEIKKIPADFIYGCNFSIRKQILENCGGFHPDAMPWDLKHLRGDGETYVSRWINEHGLSCLYDPKASVFHFIGKERMSTDYLCRRAFLQGISYSYSMTRLNPSIDKRILSLSRHILGIVIRKVMLSDKHLKYHWFYYIFGLLWHQQAIIRDASLHPWITKLDYH